MKQNRIIFPLSALGLGLLGGWLWHLMDSICRDDAGLLLPWNLPSILLGVLSVAFCAAVVWGVRRRSWYAAPCLWSALVALALGAGILWMMFAIPDPRQDLLSAIHRGLGLVAGACLMVTAVAHCQGKQPNFLLYALICCFFGIHMAQQYRIWSSDPQTADYLCQLLACVGLTLTAYHRTASAAGMGRRKNHLAISLMTAYFSMTCLFVQDTGLFYLAGGLWAALPPASGKTSGEGESL